jgi:membrane dipeptidase
MLIIDAHEDIAYNALEWGRDIRLPVQTIRRREAHRIAEGLLDLEKGPGGIAMSGLPELRRGGFGVVFGTIFAHPLKKGQQETQFSQCYRNADEAYHVGQGQIAYYRQLAESTGISLILSRDDLTDLVTAWYATREDDRERPFGLVILMEGADPIRTPGEVAAWFAQGLRIVGLAWQGTRYSGGTHAPGPLTPIGKDLLGEMERVGLILDTSHLAEESFWQAFERFHGPIIASHSNCRALTPTDRHLSDDMIRALVERDGVIGIVAANPFLDSSWNCDKRCEVHLERMVQHIDHICQLAGDSLHVGLGSDIDGGFGRDETPVELDTVADMPRLADALRGAGYSEEDVLRIMGGNWQRFLERALPR